MSKDGLKMKYFILKPEGDGPYAQASRAAMTIYAVSIKEENPVLAKELEDWARDENFKRAEAARSV